LDGNETPSIEDRTVWSGNRDATREEGFVAVDHEHKDSGPGDDDEMEENGKKEHKLFTCRRAITVF
jgi:hypothetical protein